MRVMTEWLQSYLSFSNGRNLLKYFNHLPINIRREIIDELDKVCPLGATLTFPYLENVREIEYYTKRDIDDLLKSAKKIGIKTSVRSLSETLERYNQIPICIDANDLMLACPYLFPEVVMEFSSFIHSIGGLDAYMDKLVDIGMDEKMERYLIGLSALVSAREELRILSFDSGFSGELKFACNLLEKSTNVFIRWNRQKPKDSADMLLNAYAFFIVCIGGYNKFITEKKKDNIPFIFKYIISKVGKRCEELTTEVLLKKFQDLLSEKNSHTIISGLTALQSRIIDEARGGLAIYELMKEPVEIDVENLRTYHYITAEALAATISANSIDTHISHKDIFFDIPEEMLCMLLKEYEKYGTVSLKEILEFVEGGEREFQTVFRHFLAYQNIQYKLFTISGKSDRVYAARFIVPKKKSETLGKNIIEILQISKDRRYQYEYIYN